MLGGRALRWYLAALAGWFFSFGLLMILYPWLMAVVLRESAARVGIAQMVLLAPSTLFLLLAGASADRRDGRALLLRYHLLALAPPVGLALAVAADRVTYPVVLAYGAAMGTLSAFMTPARDALLSRLAGAAVARNIALAAAAQYLFQLAGITAAGLAGQLGAMPLLAGQTAILALAALATSRLAPAPPHGASAEQGRLAAVADGLRIAAASDRIAPVMMIMAATGVFYVGAFFVVLPLLVRDVYGGGSGELAVVSACFWGGTIAADSRPGAAGAPAAARTGVPRRLRHGRARPHRDVTAGAVRGPGRALLRLGAGRRRRDDPGAHDGTAGRARVAPGARARSLPARRDRRRPPRRPRHRLSRRRARAPPRHPGARLRHVAGPRPHRAPVASLAAARPPVTRVAAGRGRPLPVGARGPPPGEPAQPLTEPATSPSTIQRWMKTYSAITGMVVMTEAAMSWPQWNTSP